MHILNSIDGRKVGTGPNSASGTPGPLISAGGFRSGPHGSQISLPGPNRVVLFDDFLGDVLADEWNAVETDTDGAQAVLAGGIGGVLRITSGNDDGNGVVLPDASGVTSYLNWQASNGDLVFQTRFKMSRITDAYAFLGFTDLTTIEAPIICNSAETITTNASDAVGFVFDTNFTADTWHLCGVAGDTDATAQILTAAPVADDYATYRIEVTAAGKATFYINGNQVGTTMSGAVTASADLTPVVLVSNQDGTSALTAEVDYIHVAMDRAADGDNV
jgi:hypothetical protein